MWGGNSFEFVHFIEHRHVKVSGVCVGAEPRVEIAKLYEDARKGLRRNLLCLCI